MHQHHMVRQLNLGLQLEAQSLESVCGEYVKIQYHSFGTEAR
jgi:hypothetical protein